MTLRRVRKVVAYITCGSRLLVFSHRDYPEVGIEVPAGTVEESEDLEKAALREAEEETGLRGLSCVRYLGVADYDISDLRPEMHERHFFHLRAAPPVPEEWLHYEMNPSGGDGKPVAFLCFWVEKDKACLARGFGAMLDQIVA